MLKKAGSDELDGSNRLGQELDRVVWQIWAGWDKRW